MSMVHGPWYMVYGPWSIVHGPWSMVHGPWSMVHGPSMTRFPGKYAAKINNKYSNNRKGDECNFIQGGIVSIHCRDANINMTFKNKYILKIDIIYAGADTGFHRGGRENEIF